MISKIEHVQINFAGDGETKEFEVDFTTIIKGEVQSISQLLPRGPMPFPEITWEKKKDRPNTFTLKLSEPLRKFEGNNGYTFVFTVVMK